MSLAHLANGWTEGENGTAPVHYKPEPQVKLMISYDQSTQHSGGTHHHLIMLVYIRLSLSLSLC